MSATRAAHPDTDPAQLAKLAARFPAEVLRNPVLPLLLLGQPDWLLKLPAPALRACLNAPDAPPTVRPALLLAAAAHPAPLVRLAAAAQPDLSARLLTQLQNDPDSHVQDLAHHRLGPLPTAAALPAAVAATLGLPLATPLSLRLQEMLEILARLPDGLAAAALPLLRTVLPASSFLAVLAARADLSAAQVLALATPLVALGDYVPGELLARLLPGPGAAASPFAPAELAAMASSADELAQRVAAAHPATPVAARRGLLRPETSGPVLQALGTNPAWTVAELRGLLREVEAEPYGPAVWEGLAANSNTPSDVLAVLLPATAGLKKPAFLADHGSLWALASSPHLTPPQLAEVLRRANPGRHNYSWIWADVLKRVARNPATPPALQAWLLLHFPPDQSVAQLDKYLSLSEWLPEAAPLFPTVPGGWGAPQVVQLPPPAKLLALLLASPLVPAGLKTLLAAAPITLLPPSLSCPAENTSSLRPALAANPAAAPAVLAVLADDPNLDVRQALARNPATGPALLHRLATDRALSVAHLAVRHPAYPAPTAANGTVDEATAVFEAADPATPPARLALLARHQRSAVRILVAGHPATPPEALTQLAQDKIIDVRAAVAANPATPLPVLAALAADPEQLVRRQAILNPRLPAAAVPARLQDKSLYNRLLLLHQPAGRLALLQAAADKTPAVRRLLQLAAPDCLTAAHRAALAASPYPADRLSVAHLAEFRQQPGHDPHLLVRAVAGG